VLLHGGVEIIGYPYVPNRFDYNHLIHIKDCAIGGTFFLKRSLLSSCSEFKDLPLGSDADYLERVALTGMSILKTDSPTYIYHREYADSITHNLSPINTL